jgi:hypothetical protein
MELFSIAEEGHRLIDLLEAIAPSPHQVNPAVNTAADSLMFLLFQSNHRLIL